MSPSQMVSQQQPSRMRVSRAISQPSRVRTIIAFLTTTVSWMLLIAVNALAAPSGSATGYSPGYSAKSPGGQSSGKGSDGGDVFGILDGVSKKTMATLAIVFGVIVLISILSAILTRSPKAVGTAVVLAFIGAFFVYGGFFRVAQNTSDNLEQYSSGGSSGSASPMLPSSGTPRK